MPRILKHALAWALLAAVVIIPRVYQLTRVPVVIVDEPANLRDIDKVMAGKTKGPQDFEWGYDKAILVQYPAIGMISLGIKDHFLALRLTSVVLSIIAVIAFFGIVRFYTNTLIGYISAMMFASSYFFLQFSRVGWTNMLSLTVGLLFLYTAILLSRKPSVVLAAGAGILGGLLLYTYRAGELYEIAGILILVLTKRIRIAIITLLLALIIALPWITNALGHWDLFTMREHAVSVALTNKPYHGLTNTADMYRYQIVTTVRSWIFMLPTNPGGTEGSRYLPLSYPPINPLLIPLYLAGLVIMIFSPGTMIPWVLLFIAGLIGGQILCVDPPNGARALILLPVIYLAVALALLGIQQTFRSRMNRLVLPAAALIVTLSDIAFYFWWMTWITIR